MSRTLASLVKISACDPIPGTDRLSVATMEGKAWTVVTGRDEFKPGDVAVYFEIDSYLPVEERYKFLVDRCLRKFVSKSGQVLHEGIRIKTIKLKGVISQGLLMSEQMFPELGEQPEYPSIGADLTELLNVKHFDEIAEALRPVLQPGTSVSGDIMGNFPSYIPKTDEERIQNLLDYFTTKKGRKFQITEKADGTSVTMFYSPTIDEENPFGVCSRNYRLKPKSPSGAVPLAWQMANTYFVESALKRLYDKTGKEYALQGELVGPGINSNRDLYTDYKWMIFRIYDIKDQKFLPPAETVNIARYALAIPHVKVLEEEVDVFEKFPDFNSLMAYTQGKTDRGNEREGIVCKTVDAPYLSFKVVSNKYLLKGE